jgi:GTP1/Obg family GTP-binding protein
MSVLKKERKEMKATKITVSAGRTFNHPFEQYANFRAHAEIEYNLEDNEDPIKAIKYAQSQVEELAEDHKRNLLKSVEELETMRRDAAEIKGLQKQISETQRRLDEIRSAHPQLNLIDEVTS